MIRWICTLFMLAMVCSSDAQNRERRFQYGISPEVNLPFLGANTEYVRNVGFGTELYINYRIHSKVKIYQGLGYSRFSYDYQEFKKRTDNIQLRLGPSYLLPSLSNSEIHVHQVCDS